MPISRLFYVELEIEQCPLFSKIVSALFAPFV